jgi:putative ABC transport system substrate-binding protein
VKGFLQAFILLGLLASTPGAVCAPRNQPIPLLALTNRPSEPHQQFLQGFRDFFATNQLKLELSVEEIKNAAPPPLRQSSGQAPVEREKPLAILALGSVATQFAIDNFKQTPVCAGMLVEDQLIKNSANATGVTLSFPITTHLQWLNRFIPHGRTIAVLFNPGKNAASLDALLREAATLDIPIMPQAVSQASDLETVLNRLPNEIGAIWSFDDAAVLTPQTAKTLLLFSFRNRIPLIGLSSQWVKAGALYALDRDYFDLGQQCAGMVLRILQGTPARQIPVETPRKVLYTINLQAAARMKLELPATLTGGAYAIYPQE